MKEVSLYLKYFPTSLTFGSGVTCNRLLTSNLLSFSIFTQNRSFFCLINFTKRIENGSQCAFLFLVGPLWSSSKFI